MGCCNSTPGDSNEISQLPEAVLKKIFRLLAPRDLRTVVLVCRRWREVGEAPRLWPWVTVTVTRENINKMNKVLARRRMQYAVINWQYLKCEQSV